MYTWNFQYISKSKLSETFDQLRINSPKEDLLVRIHTAIHKEDEAVDLARYIKNIVPRAHIVGTSTSAIINWGRLYPNQCVISVTWLSNGSVKSVLLPAFDRDSGAPLAPDALCDSLRSALINKDSRLMLTFLTVKYLDIARFVDRCNDLIPGVQMIGGVANLSGINTGGSGAAGFVFNETGYMDNGIIAASISGEDVECMSACVTGAQVVGEELTVTDTFGPCALTFNGMDAPERFRRELGDELNTNSRLSLLFPYVYTEKGNTPALVGYIKDKCPAELFPPDDPVFRGEYEKHPDIDPYAVRPMLKFNHNVDVGAKLKRAFIYDQKIISENRALLRSVENFDKAETVFGYSCLDRSMIYSNCVKWELSAYRNSNICGCITEGEITHSEGRNVFANCSFAVSVIGERKCSQTFNAHVLAHTDSLVDDNRLLLRFVTELKQKIENGTDPAAADMMKAFVKDCEFKLLYSGEKELPNEAAMYADISSEEFDRICFIDVPDISAVKTVFPEHLIDLTRSNYISKCARSAADKGYDIYAINEWRLAICTSSYMTVLSRFIGDMEKLQKALFTSSEEYIAIVPIFCVIDDFTSEDLASSYNTARIHMAQRNMQFYVYNANTGRKDGESIRQTYKIVNVINYAVANDGVIPYFQGIYDNKEKRIHHYESLMRLRDENGTIYYPGSFLDAARSFGMLYDSISKIMIRKVFEIFRDNADNSVSVNLSMRDIRNRELTSYIFDFLSTAPYPGNFVFEILESEDVDDYDVIVAFVYRIHSLGGKISIDDFGSGYSNLQHLAGIRTDYIKIDGSIIKRCYEDKESESLVALIADWKKLSPLNFEIVAEYVENEEIQQMLIHYGIDYSQGYLFSKPSPDHNINDNK